jgi:hypothetical protein
MVKKRNISKLIKEKIMKLIKLNAEIFKRAFSRKKLEKY